MLLQDLRKANSLKTQVDTYKKQVSDKMISVRLVYNPECSFFLVGGGGGGVSFFFLHVGLGKSVVLI